MNVLESPLEALALNYLSFGIFTVVNNLWTWVAVITAAVSFWRIKSAGATSCSPKPELQPRTDDPNTTGSQSQSQTVPEISPAESVFEPPAFPSFCDVKDDGETKGRKVTLYYDQEEEEREIDGEITVVKEWGDREYRDDGHEEEWWERVMRVRVVDMGWRRYQDLTVINGNIVRLWDECEIRRQRHSSCCAVGSWFN